MLIIFIMKGCLYVNRIIIIMLSNAKFVSSTPLHSDYLSKEQTTSINGIFVILVFMSHLRQYMDISGPYHNFYIFINGFMNQAIVVTFLFYSGYGIMESIKKKNGSYINLIPSKIIKLVLQFAIAIFLFLLTNWFIGNRPSTKEILMALTTLGSLGNSNWYITSILILFALTFISFKLFKNKWIAATFLVILTMMLVYLLLQTDRPRYTYNTMICFPFGIWYSLLHERIEKYLSNHTVFLLTTLITFIISINTRVEIYNDIKIFAIWMICFMIFVLLISMKISLNNPMFYYLGTKVFSIYILQRIPMMILQHYDLNQHPFTFFTISLTGTLIIATLFDKYVVPIINKLVDSGQAQLINTFKAK